ncbi:bifunctional DNA-formamidopyrimidine glycosylase/DNA-(apurinic or apyrimidinic site) lyase [Pigmentibacter sp. JX0631]|uniref:bifunctional DNA-formamidopyrimidine glycosylase/DNA-(apurinic or apyrimidinic site) lyase n=1 Tax=Pigmentibacter sp. JX0631 TaxID=2976982 RepID=UPI00246936A2|nr:bifunctional DNA-formamidopyrimidine glycosylase/DNA-(apurinic or apyrimidinic site) lyase [Pigmentibacter sp. JX0631]WGL59655.1 bifunctional DNA-formamidopyrimidine glycosylase/DNA-(apurinic or apyrimidinic site) lyase [Pigmentibacter sp. JX0631]
MPELAEVQNFVNSINKNFLGLSISEIKFHRHNLRYPFDIEELNNIFAQGASFQKVFREGKQLVIETTQGAVNISLGMSGAFKAIENNQIEKHQHVSIYFRNGSGLAYIDPRRFGFWKIRDAKLEESTTICDPLDQLALNEVFKNKGIVLKNRSIKEMLMDQKIIGGIGNIYALEALFLARISPFRACSTIEPKEWKILANQIPVMLEKAIVLGGSSIASYRSFSGNKGSFQELHQVYGRDGQKCLRLKCNGLIERLPQGGRSSWFCPICQK